MQPEAFLSAAGKFHHHCARFVVWLALIIGGGLTALFVREWWHYLIAVVAYLLIAKWSVQFYEMCLTQWWAIHGPRDDDGDDDAPPKPPPNWPYVSTRPRVDERA